MAKFEMDTEFVRKLAQVLHETNLGEIELADGERRIRIARPSVTVAAAPVAAAAQAASSPAAAAAAAANDLAKHPGAVKSPMVGTAYLAAEPGTAPFVEVGTRVAQGQTILIIEAMKTMNHIPAPKAGVVTAIFVGNGQPVEFGEPLAIIE